MLVGSPRFERNPPTAAYKDSDGEGGLIFSGDFAALTKPESRTEVRSLVAALGVEPRSTCF